MVVPAAAAAARGAAAARTGKAAKGTANKGRSGSGARSGGAMSGRADRSGAATKSDIAGMRRQAAAGDRWLQEAYEAGQEGTPWEDLVSELQQTEGARDAYETGLQERRGQARSAAAASIRGGAERVGGLRGPDWVNDGAGFLLGVLAWALAINYLQGGPRQARGWLAAKFLNRPYNRTGTAGGTAAGGAATPGRGVKVASR